MSDISALEPGPLHASGPAPTVSTSVRTSVLTAIRELSNPFWLVILGLWSAELVLLLVLQAFGTGMGLRVRQTGEDRVWAYLVQTNTLFGLPKAFWAINDRNPLSPWWYLAARPLIGASPYGIYLVRKLIDLFCATAVFVLVDRLGRGRHRLFATACAVLTLLWTFSWYMDQIMWNFIGALAVSLLMLWAYCKYVDSGRLAGWYFGLSLALYLLATATYTLQSSTFIGIFAIGVIRSQRPGRSLRDWLFRVRAAAGDTSLYVGLFVLFTLFWYTAARPGSDYYSLSPQLIRTQLLPSIKNFLWHFQYPILLKDLLGSWSVTQLILASAAGLAFFGSLFAWVGRSERRHGLLEPTAAYRRSLRTTLVLALAVALSLAAATVALESMSPIWFPGLRSTMVQQVFQPLVYLGILFGSLELIRGRAPRVVRGVEVVGAAVLCTSALLVGLQYNWQLNRRTAIEERFEAGLKALVPNPTQTKIIVRMDPDVWANSDSLSDAYIQTFYGRTDVHMRVLQPGPFVSKWENYNTVIFGTDDQGVLMGDNGAEKPDWVPYSRVRIVSFDGRDVRLMDRVDRIQMAGFRVGFARQTPIKQAAEGGLRPSDPSESLQAECTYSADLDAGLPGSGWRSPEHSPDGAIAFQWMTSTVATADFAMPCGAAATVRFRVLYFMAPEIVQSLSLQADGVAVPLKSSVDVDGEYVFTGVIPEQAIQQAHGAHQLRFSAAQTKVPEGATQGLAVAVDELDIVPALAR